MRRQQTFQSNSGFSRHCPVTCSALEHTWWLRAGCEHQLGKYSKLVALREPGPLSDAATVRGVVTAAL